MLDGYIMPEYLINLNSTGPAALSELWQVDQHMNTRVLAEAELTSV